MLKNFSALNEVALKTIPWILTFPEDTVRMVLL